MKLKVVSALLAAAAITATSTPVIAGITQDQLVGGWLFVSLVNEQAGKKIEPFGANPLGYMTLGDNGYFTQLLMRSDLKKIASGNRLKTTPEESAEIAHGALAMYGTWKLVDPNTGEISLHFLGGSFPNWIGVDQLRIATMKGDMLTFTNPTTALGTGVNTSIYKRVQ